MNGGNDYGNTVIPYDDVSYDKYHAIRGGGATGQGAGIGDCEVCFGPDACAQRGAT